jgi:phage shock protein PspC (stress-responsive transcriptional regulator)
MSSLRAATVILISRPGLADMDTTSRPPGPTRPPLVRDTRDGLVGGVAAGLARHLGVDTTLLRVAFVLTTVFLGGAGLVAYIAGWVLIPSDGGAVDASGAAQRLERMARGRSAAFWVGVGLITIGGLRLLDALLSPLGVRLWFGSLRDLIGPLVLVTIGVLLWRSARTTGPTTGPGTTTAADGPGIGAELREAGSEIRRDLGAAFREVGSEIAALEESFESYEQALEARREADGVRLGRLVIGLALLTAGLLWITESLAVTSFGAGRIAAAALAVIAVGLLVGSFAGRPRGLILAGVLLAPLVLASTITRGLPVGVDDLIIIGREEAVAGDITVRPRDLAAIEALDGGYEFGVGQVEVDLTGLDLDELRARGDAAIDIELGVGELRIVLPDTVTFDIVAELGIGRMELPGTDSSGFGLERNIVVTATGPDAPRIRLEVSQGIGRLSITVRSAS